MKQLLALVVFIPFSIVSNAQSKYADSDRETIKQYMNNRDAFPRSPENKKWDAIKNTLRQFYNAIERLDLTGTERLFTLDAKIYESGVSEGNYRQYIEGHLSPELKAFKSFAYSDYNVDVKVEGSYAFTTETYNYTIVMLRDGTEIKWKGVTTSILQKVKGEWKIMVRHSSSSK